MYERAELESQARYQYNQQIDAMRNSGDVTEAEVRQF